MWSLPRKEYQMTNECFHLDSISKYLDKYPQEAPYLSQVYIDLTLVKSWFEVKIKEVKALRKCVLLGKPSKSTSEIIVFPCAAVEIWSIERMSQLFSSLSPNNFVVDGNELKSITLAITFPDSTVVYYNIHDEIILPSNISINTIDNIDSKDMGEDLLLGSSSK
ncbi:7886_t:CDS:2 [Diversispora eburnea]|uniref:7886_t:CDS:1 n=1 Tax=Diversispora eburnea TaxID=1213867 RepID=A0A9N8WJK3_9GLOM|nr:7886_t:CDS:2 [Diversispora eburnea]